MAQVQIPTTARGHVEKTRDAKSIGPCHMGGCQMFVPFLDPCYNTAPKRDHNFDNHPHGGQGILCASTLAPCSANFFRALACGQPAVKPGKYKAMIVAVAHYAPKPSPKLQRFTLLRLP